MVGVAYQLFTVCAGSTVVESMQDRNLTDCNLLHPGLETSYSLICHNIIIYIKAI